MPEVPIFDLATLVHRAAIVMPGKALVTKPANGSGDLDFSRAGTAVRIDPNGNEETMPANVCRVDYRFTFDGNNTCPVELVTAEDSEALSLSNLVANGFTFDNCALWYTDNFQRIVKVFSSGTVTTYIDGQEVSSGAQSTPTSVSFPEGDYSTLQDLVIIKGVVDSSTAISLSTNPLLSTYTQLMIASYVNLLVKGYTVPSAAAYLSSCNEVSRLFDLGFRSFLMPGFLKAGSIPFQKFSESGGSPVYPPELIEAAFTRANAPEDSGESGAVYIDRLGDFKTLGLNLPRLTYKAGGRETEYDTPYFSFLPSAKNEIVNGTTFSAYYINRSTKTDLGSFSLYPNADLALFTATDGSAYFGAILGVTGAVNYTATCVIDLNQGGQYFGFYDGSFDCGLNLDTEEVLLNTLGATVEILTAASGIKIVSVSFTATTTTNAFFYIANEDGSRNANTNTIAATLFQLTQTSSFVGLIPTSGTGLTRQADSNLGTISTGIDQAGGFVINITKPWNRSTSGLKAFGVGADVLDGAAIRGLSSSYSLYINNANVYNLTLGEELEEGKYFIGVDNTTENYVVYKNGFLVDSGVYPSGAPTNFSLLNTGGLAIQNASFKDVAFMPTYPTATEAEKASSWDTLAEMYSDLNYDNQ